MFRDLKQIVSDVPTHLRRTAVSSRGRGSPEAAQAWIRVVLMPLLILYVAINPHAPQRAGVYETAASLLPFVDETKVPLLLMGILAFSLFFSVVLLWRILAQSATSRLRRVVTYAHDYASLGLVLLLAGHAYSLLWVPVIWLSIGNGIRFGRRDVLISTVLGLSLVWLCYEVSPSWRAHVEVLVLAAAFLLLIPLYVVFMFYQRSAELEKHHRIERELDAAKLQAQMLAETREAQDRAEVLAGNVSALESNMDRHRSTLVALTRELRAPVLTIRNQALRHPDDRSSPEVLRQADEMLLSLDAIEDIDAIASETLELQLSDVGASVFAASLIERLKRVANGPLLYHFYATEQAQVLMRMDARWAQQAIFAVFRAPIASAPRGQSLRVEFDIDWDSDDINQAYLTASLHLASPDDPRVQVPPDADFGIDLGRRLLALMDGSYLTGVSRDTLAQVEIPVKAARVRKPSIRQGAPAEKERIVVVDDHKTALSTFNIMASNLGYHVLPILHAQRAVEVVIERSPRFVFIDRHMPAMSGAELIRRIQGLPAMPTRPTIVLFSADDDVASKAEAEALGVQFLAKPIRLDRLEAVLKGSVSAAI